MVNSFMIRYTHYVLQPANLHYKPISWFYISIHACYVAPDYSDYHVSRLCEISSCSHNSSDVLMAITSKLYLKLIIKIELKLN